MAEVIQGFEQISAVALIVIGAVVVLWVIWLIKEGPK